MSLTRVFLLFTIIGFLVITSCEDKKSTSNNSSGSKNNTEQNILKENKSKTNQSIQKDSVKVDKEEPFKLTNENAKAFLLQYGKENTETKVKIATDYGDIIIQLYKDTPLHRANFIYLTKEGYFDETFFYRAAKNFVIQGGNSDRREMSKKRFEIGDYTLPQEPLKGLNHKRGAVALSKQWVDNPSNRSTPYEFFIVVAKNGAPHLDGEHTIFGKVIKGMEVADKISNVPVDQSEWPKNNIFIKAEVID